MIRPVHPDAPYVPTKGLTAEGLWWLLLLIAVAVVGAAVVLAFFARGGWIESPDLQIAVVMRPSDIGPLIQAGADPNAVDPASGETPLSTAITFSNFQSVRLLLEHGADPDIGSLAGVPLLVSPLLSYSDPTGVSMIELLVEHGADLTAQDTSHQTALHRAAEVGNLRLVEKLIAAGAAVDAMSDYGTALHIAQRNSHTPVAESLIRAGADATMPDPMSAFSPSMSIPSSAGTAPLP